jgi:hypothetical protein
LDDLPPIVRKVASTEVAFVSVDPNYDFYNDETNMTETHYLVPKAALEGLKQAMLGQSNDATRWLGDHAAPGTKRRLSYWRYVYLTEPDSILQTRPSALAQFAQRAITRRDAILIPHRLQPIPHESDVRGYKENRYWVPELNEMQHVTLIDASTREEKEQKRLDNPDESDDSDSDTRRMPVVMVESIVPRMILIIVATFGMFAVFKMKMWMMKTTTRPIWSDCPNTSASFPIHSFDSSMGRVLSVWQPHRMDDNVYQPN